MSQLIFFTLSPQETLGKTVVEALASGTSAIVFDNSGPAEIDNKRMVALQFTKEILKLLHAPRWLGPSVA